MRTSVQLSKHLSPVRRMCPTGTRGLTLASARKATVETYSPPTSSSIRRPYLPPQIPASSSTFTTSTNRNNRTSTQNTTAHTGAHILARQRYNRADLIDEELLSANATPPAVPSVEVPQKLEPFQKTGVLEFGDAIAASIERIYWEYGTQDKQHSDITEPSVDKICKWLETVAVGEKEDTTSIHSRVSTSTLPPLTRRPRYNEKMSALLRAEGCDWPEMSASSAAKTAATAVKEDTTSIHSRVSTSALPPLPTPRPRWNDKMTALLRAEGYDWPSMSAAPTAAQQPLRNAAKVSLAQAFRDVECPEDKCDDRPKGNVTIDRHHAAPNPNYRCEPASTADTEALISHSEWKERLRQGGFGQRTLKSDPEPQPEVGYLIAARNIVSELWTMAKVKVSKWLWG